MITFNKVERHEIRTHYELATPFYHLLWGPHIHHGLWQADESPGQAQRQLVDHLASAANIPRGAHVLDVGCGMGASAVYLARRHGCSVTGITLSGVQQCWAKLAARRARVVDQTHFLRMDAESADFPPGRFDCVWSIECTEHFFNKAAFFRRAAEWLRPGGRLAISAWLAGDELQTPEMAECVRTVCEGFLCPSLGTCQDYVHWIREAGLEVLSVNHLTDQVSRTWEISERRIQRRWVWGLSLVMGANIRRFLRSFSAIREAYQSGAMHYASLVARRRDNTDG